MKIIFLMFALLALTGTVNAQPGVPIIIYSGFGPPTAGCDSNSVVKMYKDLNAGAVNLSVYSCDKTGASTWAWEVVSGGGGGGGASATYQLTDFKVNIVGNTLVGSAGCGVSTPCIAPLANGVTFTTGETVGAPTGSGTAYIYATSVGGYTAGLPASGLTAASCTGCTATTGITAFPDGGTAWPIATCTAVSGTWTACVDKRLFTARPQKQFVCGSVFAEDATTVTLPCTGGTTTQQTSYRPCGALSGTGTSVADGVSVGATLPGSGGVAPCTAMMSSAGGGYVIFFHELPATWTGAVTASIRWHQGSGGAGNVQWNIDSYCGNAANALGTPSYTTVSATSAIPASDKIQVTAITPSITGCTAPSTMFLKVYNTAYLTGGTTYASNVDLVALTVSDVH